MRGCSKWACALSLAAEQSIGWGQNAWIGRLYKMDFVGACSDWASGLSLAAEQGIEVRSRTMHMAFLHVALFSRRACSQWASGLSLAPEQSIVWGQEAWIGRLYKVDFVRGCSKWACALSLVDEQSISWGQEAWIGRLYRVDFVGACSKWASGLSLAAEQSLVWGQEAWMGRLYKVGHVQSGRVGFPLPLNKPLYGVKKHGLDVCTRWTL